MAKSFSAVAFVALAVVAVIAGPAGANAVPLPIGQAGLSVTIDAASSYRQGVPYRVSGYVYAIGALPVVVELSRPVPHMDVDVLIDGGARRVSTTTTDQGYFETTFLLTGEPATHTIQAVVLRGTPAQEASATRSATIEQVFTALAISPTNPSLAVGGTQQLHAIALDDQGREYDITASAGWSTDDPAVATVSGGLVQAIATGTTTVIATYGDLVASTSVQVVDSNGR